MIKRVQVVFKEVDPSMLKQSSTFSRHLKIFQIYLAFGIISFNSVNIN